MSRTDESGAGGRDVGGPGEPAGRVTALSFTPVKGTRLQRAERVTIGRHGVAHDRRFFLVDARGRMFNGKSVGALQEVVADYDHGQRVLALRFPDGEIVSGPVTHEPDPVRVSFFSRPRTVRALTGPWAAALSRFLDAPVRVVEAAEAGTAVDRGVGGAVSLISRGSLHRLGETAAREGQATGGEIDPRRFRMLIEIDGVAAHAEDGWVGREVALGGVVVRFHGHVGRCLITSRDPDTGRVDLPTLDLLRGYRAGIEATEPLPFGVYGEVVRPGAVSVGDRVALHAADAMAPPATGGLEAPR